MPTLDGGNLVFRFPDLGENVKLTIGFRNPESPESGIRLIEAQCGVGFVFEALGRVALHLNAESPFAVLATVQGRNALTGDNHNSSLVRPQNYFATPPQKLIDGYFDGEQFAPFYAYNNDLDNRMRLNIKVFPMKSAELEWFKKRAGMCGYDPRGWGTRFVLASFGAPVYEDTRSLGDWDQNRGDEAIIWVQGKTKLGMS